MTIHCSNPHPNRREKITKYHDPHTPQAERKVRQLPWNPCTMDTKVFHDLFVAFQEISFPVAVCFAVNFIMGTALLLLPRPLRLPLLALLAQEAVS